MCREFNDDPIAYTVSGSNLTLSSAESPLIRLLDTSAELHNVSSYHVDVKYGSRDTLYVL